MVSRHICEGDIIVSRQRDLAQRLRDEGRDTDATEELLVRFEMIQAAHLAHIARIFDR